VSDRVRIQVEATDNASDDFQRIGQNAARMGQQITTAGKSAGQGLKQVGTDAAQLNRVLDQIEQNTRQTAQGLDKLAQSANKADDGIKKSRASMAAMGAAATTLAGFLSDAARAAAEEEAIFARLETAVDATGESYADYAVEIEKAIAASERLSFSDDKTAEALANLTATTGDAAEALELLGLAQDLARGKGIDLAAASNIVGRVAEGNIGILARYGIAVQEGATAQEALAAVQERYAGQAQAYADTTAGAYDRVKNSIDNFVEEIGGSTGDLQLLLTLLPGVSAGFTLVGGAAGLALQGIQKLRASSTLAAAALGPVGLGIAGVVAAAGAGYAVWNSYQRAQDNATISTAELQTQAESLLGVLRALKEAGAPDASLLAGGEVSRVLENIAASSAAVDVDRLQQASDELDRLYYNIEQFESLGGPFMNPQGTIIDQEWVNQARQQAFALEGVVEALEGAKVTEEEFAGATEDLNSILARTSQQNYPQLIAGVNALTEAHDAGLITNDAFLAGLDRLASEAETYGVSLSDVVPEVEAATRALSDYEVVRNRLMSDARQPIGVVNPNDEFGDRSAQRAAAEAQEELNASIRENVTALGAQGNALLNIKAQSNAYTQALNEANQAVINYIASGEGLLELLYESGNELSGDQGFLGGVVDLQNALAALGSAYGIIIDGSEALGASSQQLADHYSELVGISMDAAGALVYEWSLVDDLLAQGVITQEQYNAAISATESILRDNAAVQSSVAEIQVQQAGYLANLNAEAAEYVNNLADQDAQQQRNVLTLMDANSQQQLAALYSSATAAAMGDLGANGTQYVNDMAAALQVTNPLLYDMLVQSGAIKETAEGIEFNFDEVDASALVTTLADLNVAIQELVDAIHELNGTTISPNIDQAAMDALLAIGKYNPADAVVGDGTGGALGTAGGGGNVRGGEQPARTQTQVVTITADAEPYFRVSTDVQANAELLAGIHPQLIVSADGEQAIGVFRDVDGAIVAITDGSHIVTVTGDPTDALNDTALVNQVLNDLNGTEGVIYVLGDPSGALTATDAAAGGLAAVNGTSGMIYIYGDASGARAAFDSVNGLVGTSVINIIPNIVGDMTPGFRDGGVVGYDAAALDGIVTHGGYRNILVGEAGREVLSVPPGSSVRSAPMTNALTGGVGGGKEVHLHFHNAVYGFDDFQQQIAQGVRSAMYQGQYQ
jgi:hypothetical protein